MSPSSFNSEDSQETLFNPLSELEEEEKNID